jgi:hypothetical protein
LIFCIIKASIQIVHWQLYEYVKLTSGANLRNWFCRMPVANGGERKRMRSAPHMNQVFEPDHGFPANTSRALLAEIPPLAIAPWAGSRLEPDYAVRRLP